MKLKRAYIENFKGIKGPLEIDFTSPNLFGVREPRQLTCLLGDNGSGKTTVLQAIAFVLSLATHRIEGSSDFDWPGFEIERMQSLGPTHVELDITFDDEEIEATKEIIKINYDFSLTDKTYSPPSFFSTEPTDFKELTIVLDEFLSYKPDVGGDRVLNLIQQLLGRHYIDRLIERKPDVSRFYSKIGSIFWFDQFRSLNSVNSGRGRKGDASSNRSTRWRGIEQLREYLIGLWASHTSPRRNGKDYIELLQGRFNEIFPGTKFAGVSVRENVTDPLPSDFYFLLERDGKEYDLAEMSSGEQAFFPLVFEFVRHDITKSIILIDELELHLHPPEQQAMLGMLRRLGKDCQFIITTHSPYIEAAVPNEHEFRLKGGRPCL